MSQTINYFNPFTPPFLRTGIFVNAEFARMAGLHQEEMIAR